MDNTSPNQGYRNDLGNGWLLERTIRCFANFARNYDGPVDDSDFFSVVTESRFGHESAILPVLLRHAPVKALAEADIIDMAPERILTAAAFDTDDPDALDVPVPPRRPRRRTTTIRGLSDAVPCVLRRMWNRKSLRKACRAVLADISGTLLSDVRHESAHAAADPMSTRFDGIVSFLNLDPVAADVLVCAAVKEFSHFRDFPVRCRTLAQRISFYAMASDRPEGTVAAALRADAPLRRFEVLDSDGDLCSGPFRDYLEDGSDAILEGRFYKQTSVADALPLSFHGEIAARHASILKTLLASATPAHAPAILFYGPPGTGKTSFAKTLAHELSLDLAEIRQGDDHGHINATARLTGYRLANERFPAGRVIVLVDEADELLDTYANLSSRSGGRSASSRKGVVNDALDSARLPSIWIANTPAGTLDESVRRRFDYSIRFEAISPEMRLAIWKNNVSRLGLSRVLPPAAVQRLSERYPANAGGIANALENLKAARIPRRRAEAFAADLLAPHCELLGIPVGDSAPASAGYTPDVLSIDGDLAPDRVIAAVRRFHAATARAADPDRPRLHLLFYGPPGTGKTEFAKHLAREAGARLTILGGSDLLSAWVGETEANIRAAFARARSERAILFLDEADGLLMERAAANHSWELSQVNELLRAIENFEGVFIAATNFMDRLDPAVLRRFSLKLHFDYLTPDGKRLLFDRMFKTPLSPAETARLDAIPNLVPGDFRTVRQSLYYLSDTPPAPSAILDALSRETSLKRDAPSSRPSIGFAS
jgi:SpoVK/Ycf46/Vps4 family AAA+-type ATPase